MSNSAAYWSAGRERIVADPAASPSEITSTKAADAAQPTNGSNPSAEKKTGSAVVFKSQKDSPAESSASTVKRATASSYLSMNSTSWADMAEEDEEDEGGLAESSATAGTDGKCDFCDDLTEALLSKSKRMEAMQVVDKDKDQRIAELEAQAEDMQQYINDLQDEIESKDEFLSEAHATVAKMRQDMASITEKAHEEVNDLREVIEKLNLQIAKSVSLPDSDSSGEAEDATELAPANPSTIDGEQVQTAPKIDGESKDSTNDATHIVDETPSKPAEAGTDDDTLPVLSPIHFPVLGNPVPGRDFSKQVFVTASNIKRVPPPPPAPKLKMGVDTSKFVKTPQTSPASPERPQFDRDQDIRSMRKEQRRLFEKSPKVQIFLGAEMVDTVPKDLFMLVSSKAFNFWSENPYARSLTFPAGSSTKIALKTHLDWMNALVTSISGFSVTLDLKASERVHLELVQAARVLGLNNTYMGHFTKQYCEKVRAGASKELITLIDELAHNLEDPIFLCLAHNLTLEHSKASSQDRAALEAKIMGLTKLFTKVKSLGARRGYSGKQAAGKQPNARGKSRTSPKPAEGPAEEESGSPVTRNPGSDSDWVAKEPWF